MYLIVTGSEQRGLGFKMVLSWICDRREINSGPLINTGNEVIRRVVYMMRFLGIEQEGVNGLDGLVNLCQSMSKSIYDKIVQHLHTAKLISKKKNRPMDKTTSENGKKDMKIYALQIMKCQQGRWILLWICFWDPKNNFAWNILVVSEMAILQPPWVFWKENPCSDNYLVTENECMGRIKKRGIKRLRSKKEQEKLGVKKCLMEGFSKKLTIY